VKKLLLILLLTSSLQSWSLADDVRDFQIGGISIGDSLLDYYSELEIKESNPLKYPGSDKFYQIAFFIEDSKYEALSFNLKKNDKRFIIYQIKGLINYDNKIEECLREKDNIVKQISSDLKVIKEDNYNSSFNDTLGNSIAYSTDLNITNGAVGIWCTKWDKDHDKVKSMGWWDSLNVDISNNEFKNFINNLAYN